MKLNLQTLSENEKQFILIVMNELKNNTIDLKKLALNTSYDFTNLYYQSIAENIYNKMIQ